MRKSLVAISFIFLGFNSLIAADAPANAPQEKPALPVQAFTVVNKTQTTNKVYPSILKSFEEVNVMARVKGVLVEKYFNEGDFVKKGTLLYKIEPDSYLANLNMAKAEFSKAQKNYERAKSLIASKSISSQAYDDYTYQYENAKAALQQAQIQYDYTKVYAPMYVIDYVIVHELAHLIEYNHSPRFWNIVRTQISDYEEHKKWLDSLDIEV